MGVSLVHTKRKEHRTGARYTDMVHIKYVKDLVRKCPDNMKRRYVDVNGKEFLNCSMNTEVLYFNITSNYEMVIYVNYKLL